jgi:choline monooxygenase
MTRPPATDIMHALTPDASFYVDPAGLARETQSVFARSWQLVGYRQQLAESGDYFTADVGRESLLLVNDAGTLRGFFNVCRHRAGPIAYGCGRSSKLVCRYHGWTYDLGGQLLRAPEMSGVADFDPRQVHLREVAVHVFGPLLFVALDDTTPAFDEFHPGLAAECAGLGLNDMLHVMTRDYPVAANWKTYVDNFLEGYHIPLVHPKLNRELDYRAYQTQLAPRRVLQFAPVQSSSATLYRDGAGDGQAYYYWLYPNIMLNIYEGQLQTNIVIPVDVDHTIVRFDWFAREPRPDPHTDERFRALLAFSEEVQAEDAQICEAVQRNFSSRAFERGRYSAERESGLHLFHQLVHSA